MPSEAERPDNYEMAMDWLKDEAYAREQDSESAAPSPASLSRHHCDECGQDMSGQHFDGCYSIVCHKDWCIEKFMKPYVQGAAAPDAELRELRAMREEAQLWYSRPKQSTEEEELARIADLDRQIAAQEKELEGK